MYKVLYVEDEPFLAKIVCDTLTESGFNVVHILDGEEAYDRFEKEIFDICVLDIMLPNKNGYQITEQIRIKDKTIPIIFLSAKSQTEDIVLGFELGGNDYLKKPFSMEELIVRINNLMRFKPSINRSPEYVLLGKQFRFFIKKQLLENEESSIQLSYKECQILENLINNQNGIVKRQDLLKNIWGDDNYFNSTNLDVYIRKLRMHFSGSDEIQIITLKGVGYRFFVST